MNSGRIGPQISARGREFNYFFRMSHSQQQRIDAAIAPANYIALVNVQCIQQSCEIIGHHFKAERVPAVSGFALRSAVG